MREIDHLSGRILEALSEDCRISNRALAKQLDCSPQTVKRRVAWLEKEFSIRYVLEFDWEKIGLNAAYIVYAKFSRPCDAATLKKLLERYPGPQFAALTKGDFDLVIYSLGKTDLDFSKWANWFRESLGDAIAEWQPAHVTGFWFGFFPLRDELVDEIPLSDQKRRILRVLTKNARLPLKQLAKESSMPLSSTHYHLKKIVDSKYVERSTIILKKSVKPVHCIDFWKYHLTKEFMPSNLRGRKELRIPEENQPATPLIAAFNAIGPFDDVVIRSFDSLEQYPDYTEKMSRTFAGSLISGATAVVTKTLLGDLPIRKLDLRKHYNEKLEVYDLMESNRL